ncbi:MFS transporter [Parasphingopyxis marina]|uniref:Aromatic acid/H+ symport family MFS transporter n=1 Tax=Parasphingopyxis marina TaxID=2761622 RepID=A0A842I118_9SPHN|nr:aromatic acid/H+ symport family MFS transporter [Parasphingopyxis marina]MBC2778912.1 aromatic acid/H+ symport family MFS transporter [Parasphingopyxis marina]
MSEAKLSGRKAGSGNSLIVIGVCVLANMVDGFDVMAIAYTGGAIMGEWSLDPAMLGYLFSAGLAGMMLGSLFISPFADMFGRRRVALACMAAMAAGMFASGLAQSVEQLLALRLFTGLGIGGILATLNTVVAETAPPARRNLAISVFSMGYPAGSMLGGLVAVAVMDGQGWQWVFFAGGIGTFIVFLLNWAFLPEPRQQRSAGAPRFPLKTFVAPGVRSGTIIICLAFFLNMMSFFFILNWTPKLVENLGLSREIGVTATLLLNFGSLAGGLSYGVLADRLGWKRVCQIYFASFAVLIAIFGLLPAAVAPLFVVAILAGIFMAGAMTSLYALAPIVFPPEIRAGGTGLAIGIGRFGATLGPIIAGYALASGVDRAPLYILFAIPPLLVVLLMQTLRPRPDAVAA